MSPEYIQAYKKYRQSLQYQTDVNIYISLHCKSIRCKQCFNICFNTVETNGEQEQLLKYVRILSFDPQYERAEFSLLCPACWEQRNTIYVADKKKFYYAYLGSFDWQQKKQDHQKLNPECEICQGQQVNKDTGQKYPLDVYHKTLVRFCNERQEDLETRCEKCHRQLRTKPYRIKNRIYSGPNYNNVPDNIAYKLVFKHLVKIQ